MSRAWLWAWDTSLKRCSIGKGGAKIKEIQEASGARLNASEVMLPGSTEVS
ncbi:KH domain-containing protein [Enterobacter hormaechei]|uniref:KH domain-containing protein n=1 Tax=Enterobacter hormaechei TaxID=158836 RepID=UPI003A5C3D72